MNNLKKLSYDEMIFLQVTAERLTLKGFDVIAASSNQYIILKLPN